MTLALAVVFAATCAFYIWRTVSTPPLDYESGDDRSPDVGSGRHSFTGNNDKLEQLVAKLDDIAVTLEEIKSAIVDDGVTSKKRSR